VCIPKMRESKDIWWHTGHETAAVEIALIGNSVQTVYEICVTHLR